MSSSRPQPSPRQQHRQIAPGQRIARQSAPPKRTPLAVKVIVGSIVGLLALGTLGFCGAVLVAITGEAPAAAPNQSHDVEPQTPAQQLRMGKVNARTQGLDGGQLQKASTLGAWLTRWQQTGIEHSDDPAAEVRRLARSYKATGVASRKVTTLLEEAASQLDQARDATDRGSYSAAIRHHKEAAAKLKGVAPRVRADVERTEHATGARINGRNAASSTNYNYLFPVTVKTSTARVIRWIDGDTVVTTRGRVRLLGIDTPELKGQGPCSQARAAKEYAESLAPPGTTVVLTNPASVDNRDRYGRLLVYVDLVGNDSDKTVTEVGYSLLLSSLAVARYDSVDGYQWHPREHLYRNTAAAPADGSCMRGTEQEAFVSAASRAAHQNTDEYWRKRLLGKALDTPHNAARKLTKTAEDARQRHNEQVQRERARQRELDRAGETYDNDTNGNNDDRGKGGGYDGYTGPRCYAPGGKTWKPC